MRNEFTAIIERDDDWYIAYCPEIPGANGQGHSKEAARASLAEAIALILEDRREDALRGVPPEAERDNVIVSGEANGAPATSAPLRLPPQTRRPRAFMADQNVTRKFAAILMTDVAGIDGHGTLTNWLARIVAR